MKRHTKRAGVVAPGALVIGAILVAVGAAEAMPSIGIASPTPGQPLSNLQPTITIAYSTDGAPLNLDTLLVNVNGVAWTAKFTKGPDSASYTVAGADTLVAGTLVIEASIADQDGGSASTNQTYAVFPTLQALTPSSGKTGTAVTVRALGLDPNAANNSILFFSIRSAAGVAAPFTSVNQRPTAARSSCPRMPAPAPFPSS